MRISKVRKLSFHNGKSTNSTQEQRLSKTSYFTEFINNLCDKTNECEIVKAKFIGVTEKNNDWIIKIKTDKEIFNIICRGFEKYFDGYISDIKY